MHGDLEYRPSRTLPPQGQGETEVEAMTMASLASHPVRAHITPDPDLPQPEQDPPTQPPPSEKPPGEVPPVEEPSAPPPPIRMD